MTKRQHALLKRYWNDDQEGEMSMDRDELLRQCRDTLGRIAEYSDYAGTQRAFVAVKDMARSCCRMVDAELAYLTPAPQPSTAAIVQVMDAEGKYPAEKQLMTITTTTNAAPDAGLSEKSRDLHIVFDGPPGPQSGRFVECETSDGKGVSVGKWEERENYWHLIIPNALSSRGEREKT